MSFRRGFTLVELLVVMAIIALLAAMLMPALAAARGVARQTSCLNNLRNMNVAVQMYVKDHDGFLPGAYVPDDRKPGYTRHVFGSYSLMEQDCLYDRGTVEAYMGSGGESWNCPGVIEGEMLSLVLPENRLCSAYGYNVSLAMEWTASGAHRRRIGVVERPELTMLFCDSAANYTVSWGQPNQYGNLRENWTIDWYPVPDWGLNRPELDGTTHFRHRGKANVAFCDGHAELIFPPDGSRARSNNWCGFAFMETDPYYSGKWDSD